MISPSFILRVAWGTLSSRHSRIRQMGRNTVSLYCFGHSVVNYKYKFSVPRFRLDFFKVALFHKRTVWLSMCNFHDPSRNYTVNLVTKPVSLIIQVLVTWYTLVLWDITRIFPVSYVSWATYWSLGVKDTLLKMSFLQQSC